MAGRPPTRGAGPQGPGKEVIVDRLTKGSDGVLGGGRGDIPHELMSCPCEVGARSSGNQCVRVGRHIALRGTLTSISVSLRVTCDRIA